MSNKTKIVEKIGSIIENNIYNILIAALALFVGFIVVSSLLSTGAIVINEEKQISGYTSDVDYISGGFGQVSKTIVTFDTGEMITFVYINEIPSKQNVAITYKDTLCLEGEGIKRFISCEVIQEIDRKEAQKEVKSK